jgi:hypothetical protein
MAGPRADTLLASTRNDRSSPAGWLARMPSPVTGTDSASATAWLGQRSKATSAPTTTSIARAAAISSPVVPRLEM